MKDHAKSRRSAPLVSVVAAGHVQGRHLTRVLCAARRMRERPEHCQSPLGPLAAVFGGSRCGAQRTA